MGRELYPAASGMARAWKQMDILANNLANGNSTAFKQDRPVFEVQEPENVRPRTRSERLLARSYATTTGVETDFRNGHLRDTGNPLDLAIEGQGMFVVAGEDGEPFLTRDGAFQLDQDGTLVTRDGLAVQGRRGNIRIPSVGVEISEGGEVRARGGRILDVLQVVEVEDASVLEKRGENLYVVTDEAALQVAEDSRVSQGSLEQSNLNPVRAIVDLIGLTRYYQAMSKVTQTGSQMDQRRADQIIRSS